MVSISSGLGLVDPWSACIIAGECRVLGWYGTSVGRDLVMRDCDRN